MDDMQHPQRKRKLPTKREESQSPVPVAPIDERVKEIGRKARIRLEEEKSKRKEIVVLDGKVAPERTDAKTKTASKFSKAIKQSSKVPKKTRPPPPRKRRKTTASSSPKNVGIDKSIDTWSPSTDGVLYYNLSKGDKSSMVRLHGLPIGTKVDHVRKFFTGLSPDRVFILLSADTIIPGFDCGTEREGGRKKNKVVKRHAPSFRVIVKFKSAPTADIAIGRSGEVMSVDSLVKGGKSKTCTGAISISPVSKQAGICLQNNLMIECPKGSIIADELKHAEEGIPSIVNHIQWVNAARTLRLDLDIQTIGGTNGFPLVRMSDIFNVYFPTNDDAKESLIRLHNKLLDIYEAIEEEFSPLQFNEHIIDIEQVSTSSVHRLTNHSATWLLNQMESIEKCLVHK
jgi:hypothetical protein